MLDYIENVDYNSGKNDENNIDSLIAEYAVIYKELKRKILREIKLKQLAITAIAPDLLRLYKANPKKLEIVLYLLQNPFASYGQIGRKVGLSKQRIHIILRGLGKQCFWVENLLNMKAEKG